MMEGCRDVQMQHQLTPALISSYLQPVPAHVALKCAIERLK